MFVAISSRYMEEPMSYLWHKWSPSWLPLVEPLDSVNIIPVTCSSTLIPSFTWTHVGGKSICLRFVGMAVLMPQCGNFVPAGLEILIVRWMESPHSCPRWWRRPTVYCPQPQPPPQPCSPPTARSWLTKWRLVSGIFYTFDRFSNESVFSDQFPHLLFLDWCC